YNVAPTRYQPVVRQDPKTGSYVVHMMRWGLIPRHTQAMPDYRTVLKSINARDDSLFTGPTEKHMFKHSKNHKRCILLAQGFYEWRRRGKERVPFYTKRRDGDVMLMAAIYDVAKVQGAGEPLYTYATITTNASPELEWLHDRMPVLISNWDKDKIRLWLDPNITWNSTLQAMLHPCDEYWVKKVRNSEGRAITHRDYALETYQVDEKVNSVRNDAPHFIEPWISTSNKQTLSRFLKPKDESKHADQEDENRLRKEPDILTAQQQIEHDKDLELALELSRLENERETDGEVEEPTASPPIQEPPSSPPLVQIQTPSPGPSTPPPPTPTPPTLPQPTPSTLPTLPPPPTTSSSCSPVQPQSDSKNLKSSIPTSTTRDVFVVTREGGSVDLLQKRRQELQQDEDQMRQVLEMSRLEAIASGHETPSDSSDRAVGAASHPFTTVFDDDDLVQRQEQEEMERAIAASLSVPYSSTCSNGSIGGSGGGGSGGGGSGDDALTSSQQSVESNNGSVASKSLSPPRPSKRTHSKVLIASPTTSKRQKRPSSGNAASGGDSSQAMTSPSPSRRATQNKSGQTAKITSFFQHSNSS
ncbi:hypothetical protein BG004_008264, partial [Podila humilis]